MSNEYLTVAGECEITNVIERSKFICNIKGIENEEQAKEYLEILRKRHSLATHSCYAYIADEKGLVQKFSDAGEPQGTAGIPILEVLKNRHIFKVVAVVTRYFGGIKLGAGGLVRAYGGAVADCLNVAKIANMCQATLFECVLNYDGYSKLLRLLENAKIAVLNTKFENDIKVILAVKDDYCEIFNKKLLDLFNGKVSVGATGKGYYNFR